MSSLPGLFSLFLVFLKMGATAFGGNVALVAAIRREICEKRKWLSDQEVLDIMVIGNILPGPLASNVVFACGRSLHGLAGAFVALLGVLLPAFILMCIMSWAYFTLGNNATVTAVMNGIIPCVAAIVAATAWSLHQKNVKGWLQYGIVIGSAIALLVWKGFFLTMIIVVTAGVLGRLLLYSANQKKTITPTERSGRILLLPGIAILVFTGIFFLPELPVWLAQLKSLALTFGSMSVTLFGGGYVFIPAMEKVVVHEMAWMTTREFTEGIAMGQITPGPIMISSVFIGWKVAGLKGAAVAAISLFVPPAILMYVAQHFMERIKGSAVAESVFRGVRPAVIGMIFASVWVVFTSGEVNYYSAAIFGVMLVIAIWKNPEPLFMIIGSGLLGWLIF